MAQFELLLAQTEKQIEDAMQKELVRHLNLTLIRSAATIAQRIRQLIRLRLINSDTYKSLTRGKLWHEFGIVGPENRLNTIISILLDNINVEVKPIRKITKGLHAGFQGGLRVHLLDTSYQDILRQKAAVQRTFKGVDLEWLRWLLLEGDKIVVREYNVRPGKSVYSRTGDHIMVFVPGRGRWKVPKEFSGTRRKNWLTKTYEEIEPQIAIVMETVIKQQFNNGN